ncbi:MAG: response regulator [Betaproteobacteria bacterium]|nr:response regulator [Betaproteobacteria bacterium]
MTKPAFCVRVLGFNATENLVLGSIFGLAARRNPKYFRQVQETGEPDLCLVDADDPDAMAGFLTRHAAHGTPAVLIGRHDHGTGLPCLPRPLQWARLFVAFDQALGHEGTGREPDVRVRLADDPDATQVVSRRPRLAPPSPDGGSPGSDPPAANGTAKSPIAPDAGSAATGTGPGAVAGVSGSRVLIVDTDPGVRAFVRDRLERYRLHVETAESGAEAVRLAAQGHYACVFVAADLPDIDGYRICKAVKTRKAARPTAVVMLSVGAAPGDRIRAKMAGCDAFLAKPVDRERLLEAIARFLPAAAAA